MIGAERLAISWHNLGTPSGTPSSWQEGAGTRWEVIKGGIGNEGMEMEMGNRKQGIRNGNRKCSVANGKAVSAARM